MQFPLINSIEDVLPHIEGRPEFVVAEKEGYTVINYNVVMPDTFPGPEITEWTKLIKPPEGWRSQKIYDETSLFRRECRGIIFCSKTGEILRRPLQKFFNVNERDETRLANLPWLSGSMIMEKLDGSMIAPFKVNGQIVWGTKMAAPDFHDRVKQIVNSDHIQFTLDCLENGYTPIFEYIAPNNRIVLHYPQPKLILLAVREMKTGKYSSRRELENTIGLMYPSIELVNLYTFEGEDFLNHVRSLEDVEGFVCQNDRGEMVKAKCDWYVQLHKTIEHLTHEKDVIRLLLDNQLDDAKQILPKEQVEALEEFNSKILKNLAATAQVVYWDSIAQWDNSNGSRKEFALWAKEKKGSIFYFKALDFILEDEAAAESRLYTFLVDYVRNSCSSQTKVNEVRYLWGNAKWEDMNA